MIPEDGTDEQLQDAVLEAIEPRPGERWLMWTGPRGGLITVDILQVKRHPQMPGWFCVASPFGLCYYDSGWYKMWRQNRLQRA
jgi:hypothetical protein